MDRDPASPAPALMECRPGWLGLTPLVLNPTFTDVDDIDKLAQGTEGVEWTHWADLINIYGTDPDGFARRAVGQRRRAVRARGAARRHDHARRVPRPQRRRRRLEAVVATW